MKLAIAIAAIAAIIVDNIYIYKKGNSYFVCGKLGVSTCVYDIITPTRKEHRSTLLSYYHTIPYHIASMI